MAVGVQLDFPGGTLEQYDQVIKEMGLTQGGPVPPGGLFHWVRKTDDGIRVTDVWETREQFDAFAQSQIGPVTRQYNLAEPEVQFFEVHNYLAKA